jgi:hypothetical protein
MTAISGPLTTAGTQAKAEIKATQQQVHQQNMDASKSRNACKSSEVRNLTKPWQKNQITYFHSRMSNW